MEIDGHPERHATVLARLGRMLGIERDLTEFNRAASAIAWLHPIALRMRGVKPPQYATIWEACVNAIIFGQLSLHAASAIFRHLLDAVDTPLDYNGVALHAFPDPARGLALPDEALRRIGPSSATCATLRRIDDALASAHLDIIAMQERTSAQLIELLCEIKGIGAWTAAVILLRGLGRLDVFPMNDSGFAQNLALLTWEPIRIAGILDRLGTQRGMLYYHVLLARLEAL